MLEQVKIWELVVKPCPYLASSPATSHVAESTTTTLFGLCPVVPVYVAVLHKGCESRYVCRHWFLYTSLEQQDLKLHLNILLTHLFIYLLTYSMKQSPS